MSRVRLWQQDGAGFCCKLGSGWVKIHPARTGLWYVTWSNDGIKAHYETQLMHPWHTQHLPYFTICQAIHRAKLVMKLEFKRRPICVNETTADCDIAVLV